MTIEFDQAVPFDWGTISTGDRTPTWSPPQSGVDVQPSGWSFGPMSDSSISVNQSDGTGGMFYEPNSDQWSSYGDPEPSALDKLLSGVNGNIPQGAKDFFGSKFGTAVTLGFLQSLLRGNSQSKEIQAMKEIEAQRQKNKWAGAQWATPHTEFMGPQYRKPIGTGLLDQIDQTKKG